VNEYFDKSIVNCAWWGDMRKAPGECAVDISLYSKGVGKSSRFVRAGMPI